MPGRPRRAAAPSVESCLMNARSRDFGESHRRKSAGANQSPRRRSSRIALATASFYRRIRRGPPGQMRAGLQPDPLRCCRSWRSSLHHQPSHRPARTIFRDQRAQGGDLRLGWCMPNTRWLRKPRVVTITCEKTPARLQNPSFERTQPSGGTRRAASGIHRPDLRVRSDPLPCGGSPHTMSWTPRERPRVYITCVVQAPLGSLG